MLLEVGRITKPHGVRGEVVVALSTDRLERLAPGAELDAGGRVLVVETARPHQQHHIVRFAGLADRREAEALAGRVLRAAPLDDPEEIWVHELIGAPVVDLAGAAVGTIESVQANPAADLLVLDGGALVPAVFVVERRGDGTVVIDPPAGLFEL